MERKPTLPRMGSAPAGDPVFARAKNTLFRGLSLAQIKPREGDIPGPGMYGAPSLPGPSGGRFNESNPKSELDWVTHRAKMLPGPGEYGAPKLPGPSGGKFNESRPKTELEWIEYFARQLPAPGDYGAPRLPGPSGGKFNESNPKSELDWVVYRAKQLPGAAEYNVKFESCSNKALRRGPSARQLGKVVQGNRQTTMPSAVGFKYYTVNDKGPNQCDMTSAFLSQARGDRPNPPSIVFSQTTGFAGTAKVKKWKPKPVPADPVERLDEKFMKSFGYTPMHKSGKPPPKSKAQQKRGRPATRASAGRRPFGSPLDSPGGTRGRRGERSVSPDAGESGGRDYGIEYDDDGGPTIGRAGTGAGADSGTDRPTTAPTRSGRQYSDEEDDREGVHGRSKSPAGRGTRRRRRRFRRKKKKKPEMPMGRPVFGGTVPLSHQPPGVGQYSPYTSSFGVSPYSTVKSTHGFPFTVSDW